MPLAINVVNVDALSDNVYIFGSLTPSGSYSTGETRSISPRWAIKFPRAFRPFKCGREDPPATRTRGLQAPR